MMEWRRIFIPLLLLDVLKRERASRRSERNCLNSALASPSSSSCLRIASSTYFNYKGIKLYFLSFLQFLLVIDKRELTHCQPVDRS